MEGNRRVGDDLRSGCMSFGLGVELVVPEDDVEEPVFVRSFSVCTDTFSSFRCRRSSLLLDTTGVDDSLLRSC